MVYGDSCCKINTLEIKPWKIVPRNQQTLKLSLLERVDECNIRVYEIWAFQFNRWNANQVLGRHLAGQPATKF